MKRSAMVVRIGTWSRTTSQKRMINSILIDALWCAGAC
jgi:hypothetical protein